MAGYVPLPQYDVPRNALLDFSGINNALQNIGQTNRAIEAEGYQRQRQAVADGRAARAEGRAQQAFQQQQQDRLEDRIGQRVLAASKLPPNDPRRASVLDWAIKQHPNAAALPPEYRDPVKGLDLIAADYGQFRDPNAEEAQRLELETKRVQLEKMRREATAPSSSAPQVEEFYDDQGRKSKRQWNAQTRTWEQIGGAAAAPEDTALARAQTQADVKRVTEYKDAADAAAKGVGDLGALRAARDKTSLEGPLMGWIAPYVSSGGQEVQSTSEAVRMGFVAQTKGAVSDAEMRIFGMASPGLFMRDSAAGPVMDFMELGYRRTQEKGDFFDTWLRAKGSLDGASEAWNRFINAKPILSRDQKGEWKLNPENVGGWREYIPQSAPRGQQQGGQAPAAQPPAAPAGVYDWSPDRGLTPRGQ